MKNLFVTQKYREKKQNEFSEPQDDLSKRIRRFFDQDQEMVLLIEADAGCGKSSLAAWLNYHVAQANETAWETLGGRPLLTIRLRDLDRETIRNNDVGKAIEEKTGWSKETLLKTFPQAVVFFDGFDELCMIDDITKPNILFDWLRIWLPYGYKAIITSRINYIDRSWIDHRCILIVLEHFDREKREEWIQKYSVVCGQRIDEDVKQFILNADENSDAPVAIFNTPLTLYMLAAQSTKINIGAINNNNWVLYHALFHDVIPDAEHRGGPGRDYDYRALIYRLTEEIAHIMYQNNQKYHLESNCIKGIIKNLAESAGEDAGFDEGAKELLKRAYVLHSYWKADGETGTVEFYHNNIRDYFLCERVYRLFNVFYQKCNSNDNEETRLSNIKDFARDLTSFFKFGYLENRVLDFIRDRAMYKKNNDFPQREKELHLLPDLYQYLLTDGCLYDGLGLPNHAQAIESVQRNTAMVYHSARCAILSNRGEYLHWWRNTKEINEANAIKYFFVRFMAEITARSDFSELNLAGTYLQNSDLQRANFQKANLQRANMNGAYLQEAQMQRAQLHLSDLRGADLRGADLRDAVVSFYWTRRG